MRTSVLLVLLLGAAVVAAAAAGDTPGSLNAAAPAPQEPAAAPQQPISEPSKPAEQVAPQQPAVASPAAPAQQAEQQPTADANGGNGGWSSLGFFSQRLAAHDEELKATQQQKQQQVEAVPQEQPMLRPLREQQEEPVAGLQRQLPDLNTPLGMTSYLNGGGYTVPHNDRPRNAYYEQPHYEQSRYSYREEPEGRYYERDHYARDHYEDEHRQYNRRYTERDHYEAEEHHIPSYGRSRHYEREEHEERHSRPPYYEEHTPPHREERYRRDEREASEQERVDKLTRKRLSLLTGEEQQALEEFYKHKFGAKEVPKPEAPKPKEKKAAEGKKKVEETPKKVEFEYPSEEHSPTKEATKGDKQNKYYKQDSEEAYEQAPHKHYREEHEYHHFRNNTGAPTNSIFHMFHNDGYYGGDSRPGYYEEDEEPDFLDGFLYMPGPEGVEGAYTSVQAVEEFSDDHIDAAVCLLDKAAAYTPANNTDPVKPTSITTELTCCDGKLVHKREHLRRLGVPVVNGIDEVTVASCTWSIEYFSTAIPAYDDIFAVGYANVTCAFNAAAHLCGKIPGDLELAGQGLVFAVPAKMQKRVEHRPSHRGDYRYDDYYPDAIDISFHRTKVVVSPAAGAAQVASAEEPAYRKYADQDKYYEEDEEKYYEVDEYGHESLGPIVIGHSLIAKVPLGKDTSYGVKIGGVLEYTINFWNDQVAVLPNSPPLAANTTATMRPHEDHRLVKPGKYWLMLDEDYGHAPYYGRGY